MDPHTHPPRHLVSAVSLFAAAISLLLPAPASGQGVAARGLHLSSSQVIERRVARAEALRRERLARLRAPGISIAESSDESAVDGKGKDVSESGSLPRASVPDLVTEASNRYHLPPALVHAIIRVESGYDTSARSHAGATGLMQVMPFWPRDLGHRFGSDLTDEETNLKYGTWVLQNALRETGGDLRRALLRYNGCTRAKCATYPDRVRRLFEAESHESCGGAGWNECVVEPVRRAYAEAG